MDKTGRRTIGSPTHGCRHCGAVNETESGHVVVYTPATECCPGALLDRIQRRSDEISTLRAYLERSASPATQKQVLVAIEDRDRLREKLRRMEEAN